MRGENSPAVLACPWAVGSSPHARGKPDVYLMPALVLGLIPACAGKTLRFLCACQGRRAHPRMRGENAPPVRLSSPKDGSSPHARGKPYSSASFTGTGRLIPACAGKTKSCEQKSWCARAHPRMRGENTPYEVKKDDGPGSSPHARGKPWNSSP